MAKVADLASRNDRIAFLLDVEKHFTEAEESLLRVPRTIEYERPEEDKPKDISSIEGKVQNAIVSIAKVKAAFNAYLQDNWGGSYNLNDRTTWMGV